MRILILTNMYPNPSHAHSGIWLHEIVKKLQKKGYQFRVAFSVPSPPFPFNLLVKWNKFSRQFPDRHEVDGVVIDFLRYYSSYRLIPHRHMGTAYLLSQRRNLHSIIDNFRPDLLWAQPSLPNGWATMKICQARNLPYVMTVLGSDINESTKLPGATQKLKRIYDAATSVVVNSERLSREVNRIAPTANRQLIHFGIDPDTLMEASEVRKNYLRDSDPQKPLRILSVSNLIETKGIQYNIQAIGRLVDMNLNIEYTVVGDGVYLNTLKDLTAKLGLDKYIRFVGKLSPSNSLIKMAETDIFSLPSYQEGMGMVYLEAMALGVPAIGIKGQGIEDVIENGVNGILIDPNRSDVLAEAILQLAAHADFRKSLGSCAKLHIHQNFAWETTCAHFDEIFHTTIAKNSPQKTV